MRIGGTKIRVRVGADTLRRRPTALGEGHIIKSKAGIGLQTKDGTWIKTKQ
jgi:hypothetical protein